MTIEQKLKNTDTDDFAFWLYQIVKEVFWCNANEEGACNQDCKNCIKEWLSHELKEP